MEPTCHYCGDAFVRRGPRHRFCRETCARAFNRERERMRNRDKRGSVGWEYDPPTSGNLARLKDVPLAVRLRAFRYLVDRGELSEDEVPLALLAALEPGDLSMRAA